MKRLLAIAGILLLVISASATVTQFNSTVGGDTVWLFNGTGTVNVTVPAGVTSVWYLVVAGGGSGGGNNAGNSGGGGAGGLLNGTMPVTAGTELNITVGSGGATVTTDAVGNDGGHSLLKNQTATIDATGGGGGGKYSGGAGRSGGSGGGGAQSAGNGGAGTAGQGSNGGNAYISNGGGGGGGGSATTGQTAPSANGGLGGNGNAISITGISTYYAGGGGGSTHNSANYVATGGLGGGGWGCGKTASNQSQPGVNGTGGGGGAGGESYCDGQRGGDGVIILRYTTPATPDPIVSFTSNVTSGTSPFAVQFNDTSVTSPTAWNWSYTNVTPGNNTPIYWSTDQNATQIFGNGHWHINLNVTNASGYNDTALDYHITVSDSGGLSGWQQQDILMEGIYTLQVAFKDSVTHSAIPVVNVIDSNAYNQTTSTGTFSYTYNYSVVVLYISSDGYTSTSRSYVMDQDRSATVYLTESTTPFNASPATVQSYPKYVTFHVKQGWGADLDEVLIEMTPVSTSTGDWDWLATILGVDLGEVPLNTNAMNQTTDSFGTATFYVFPTAKYNVTFTKAGYTIPSMILVPRDDHYIIYATSAATTYYKHGVNELEAVNLTITSVYVNETYSFLNMTYDDSTMHTTGGYINVTQQTGTPGSSAYTILAAWPVTGNSFSNSTGISHNLNHVGGFVNATITHSDFGTIHRTFPFQFNSVPVSFLGFGANIQMLVALGMMLFTAMLAGATHGKQVILVVAIEGWIFDTMGWFTHMISRGVPHYAIWTALTIMTIIAILANMANRKKWL